jgi:hypothetical protein
MIDGRLRVSAYAAHRCLLCTLRVGPGCARPLRYAMSNISWLNPTPHATAVYGKSEIGCIAVENWQLPKAAARQLTEADRTRYAHGEVFGS